MCSTDAPQASPPRPVRRETWRYALWTAVGVAISIATLCAVYLRLGIHSDTVRAEWARADKALLAAAVIFSTAWFVLVGAHKLYLVLRAMGVDITFGDTMRLRLGESPLRLLLPLRGGEVLAVVFFWRHKRMPVGAASGALVFDRSLNLFGLSFWLAAGLVLLPGRTTTSHLLGLLALIAVFGLFLLWPPLPGAVIRAAGAVHARAGGFVRGLLSPWRDLPAGRKLLLAGYGTLFVSRSLVVCWLLFAAYGVHPGPVRILSLLPVAMIAGGLPGPFLGIGPREGLIAWLFASHAPSGSSIPLSVGVLLTAAVHVLPLAVGLPWVPWFLRRLGRAR